MMSDKQIFTTPPARNPAVSDMVAGIRQGIIIAAGILVLTLPPSRSASVAASALPAAAAKSVQPNPRFADFSGEPASFEATYLANWIADSGDNQSLSFVIIDKKNARVFVFGPQGKLLGATPVLLGAAPGDDSVLGIGKKAISDVKLKERTTPAGRFLGEPGRNSLGEDVIWVDYDAAVSMHRVRIVDPKERRLERLASPETDDNRISYGCVNVPVAFFENVLSPVFKARYGVVYVLPEVKSLHEVFANVYDPAEVRPRPASP